MAGPAKSAANQRLTAYDVLWKTETVGWTKDVDPSGFKPIEIEKKIGELHDIVIDRLIIGGEGDVKMTLHETIEGRLRQLMPWAGATGSFPQNPPATTPYSEYANSGLLVLKPKGVSGTADELHYLHAFPIISPPKGGARVFGEIEVIWRIYHDQAALTDDTTPTATAAYVGPEPE